MRIERRLKNGAEIAAREADEKPPKSGTNGALG